MAYVGLSGIVSGHPLFIHASYAVTDPEEHFALPEAKTAFILSNMQFEHPPRNSCYSALYAWHDAHRLHVQRLFYSKMIMMGDGVHCGNAVR